MILAMSILALSGLISEEVPTEPEPVEPVSPAVGNNQTDWSGLLYAYFPESEIPTALDIIACESGGNPQAQNPSGASGLFQIMPFWADHFGIARAALFDPSINTDIALRVWERQGWEAWTCYSR